MGGIIEGAFYSDGLFDGSPLFDYIEALFSNSTLQRALNIGITNILNGKFTHG